MLFNKKVITKEFYNVELINVANWYEQNRQENRNKFNALPFQVQLALRTNLKEVNKITGNIMEMRNEFSDSLRKKYFVPEKTEEIEQNGEKAMKLKDEYIAEYQAEGADYDKKLQEVLKDKTKITLTVFNMDSIYETLPDDCELNMDDIDMLSFMDNGNDENTTEGE